MFHPSLLRQKGSLDLGILWCSEQPCQRHPSTKMASLPREKIKSGFPDNLALRRYRYPSAQSALRSEISGFVSLPRMRDIHLLRCFGVKISVILFYFNWLETILHILTWLSSPFPKNLVALPHFSWGIMPQVLKRVLDIFSGGGGSSYGARNAGATIVAAVDMYPIAIETYKANFPEAEVLTSKLEDINPTKLRNRIPTRRGGCFLKQGST